MADRISAYVVPARALLAVKISSPNRCSFVGRKSHAQSVKLPVTKRKLRLRTMYRSVKCCSVQHQEEGDVEKLLSTSQKYDEMNNDSRSPLLKKSSIFPPGLAARSSDLDPRVLFAEFLSTFLFVYLSLRADASTSAGFTPLTNGAIIAAVVASFLPVSGAHLNPAVTLALTCTYQVPIKRALVFIPLQLAASAAAAYLVKALGVPIIFAGIPERATQFHLVQAFFSELIPMFAIVTVVFQTAVATKEEGGVGPQLAAVYIGLVVFACASTSTGIFNPARAFGPALATSNFASHWIFWIAPIIGSLTAALFLSFDVFPRCETQPCKVGRTSLPGPCRKQKAKQLAEYNVGAKLEIGEKASAAWCCGPNSVGLPRTASDFAKAWLVIWTFSQVTKPARLLCSIALAPFIERRLKQNRHSA